MIVVSELHNLLSSLSAEHLHVRNILYVKKNNLLVAAGCRLFVT